MSVFLGEFENKSITNDVVATFYKIKDHWLDTNSR